MSVSRPGRAGLEDIIRRCGLQLTHEELDLLWTYHTLLRAANTVLNMTRIHNFENMVLKHYVDSLLVLRFLDLPSPLIDMGSGPGLPGIPLKITRPKVRMILAEPRQSRADFLVEVGKQLGLGEFEVYAHKLGSDYPGKVSGVISRAVATIPDTLDRVARCIEPGGKMIFMKGPGCDPEIDLAAREAAATFRLSADHAYEIPGTPHQRRLVIYERLDTEPTHNLRRVESQPSHQGLTRDISSPSNPSYRQFVDLLGGQGIRKHGRALLSGPRICTEVQERFPRVVQGWLTDPQGPPPPRDDWTWIRLDAPLFKNLDISGTHAPLLLVDVPVMTSWSDEHPWPPGCTLFVPFQDPENVGAVIRSAAAFGVSRVVLLREAAHPFHPRSSRAAGPSLFEVPLLNGPSINELDSKSQTLIALDKNGNDLGESSFPGRFGLVVGVEGPGLPPHLRQGKCLRIPISTGIESLNAATAAAIAMYAWARNRARTD